jgi:PKD repeat protein
VTNSSGVVGTDVTDGNGYYEICGLLPGDYTVCEDLKGGWVNITPTCFDVTLVCSNVTVDFENDPNGSICGFKLDQSCGCGISGWTIQLYNATSGALLESNTTDSTGKYCFMNLTPGAYRVSEVLQSGWTAITPVDVQVSLTEQNPNVNNVNFTNALETICCSCSPNAKFTYTKLAGSSGNYPVQFTDTSIGPRTVQWYWRFGDGSVDTTQNPLHVYKRSGTYTVILSIKWADCAGKTSSYWKSYTQTVKVP